MDTKNRWKNKSRNKRLGNKEIPSLGKYKEKRKGAAKYYKKKKGRMGQRTHGTNRKKELKQKTDKVTKQNW